MDPFVIYGERYTTIRNTFNPLPNKKGVATLEMLQVCAYILLLLCLPS